MDAKTFDPITRKNMDPSLMRCEVWNPYKFPIVFRIQLDKVEYLKNNGRKIPVPEFSLKPNHAIILSHQYWNVECNGIKDNKQIFLPMNLGNDIGKNIRWLPGPKEAGFLEVKKIIQTINNG